VVIAAVFYIAAGSLHFIRQEPYFKDHAALYPVARGDGAGQRGFRDHRRAGVACASNAKGCSVRAGGAADRGFSCQPLYGDASSRVRRGWHRAGAEVGAASVADIADLVAGVVRAAEIRGALKVYAWPAIGIQSTLLAQNFEKTSSMTYQGDLYRARRAVNRQ
jgi:hypothetical protein